MKDRPPVAFGRRLLLWLILAVSVLPGTAAALNPDEILVVANRNAARSIGLATYYIQRRGIPQDRLVALWIQDAETCSRQEYDRKVVLPIRCWLAAHPEAPIRCLVTVFGVPLKIAPTVPPEPKRPTAVKKPPPAVRPESTEDGGNTPENDARAAAKARAQQQTTGAALDSELCLIKAAAYPLEGWRPNPFFIGNRDRDAGIDRNDVLMVSRLDGPSSEVVRRIIDDSLAAEAAGLSGTAYFDARWPLPAEDRSLQGYALYDRLIHRAAEMVRKTGRMPVRLDDRQTLFQPGEGPDAALYCGWYSLSRYVDAFAWKPGAVGYHIASGECTTLHDAKSQVWCVQMLTKGAAATIGPVAEPYIHAFPVPDVFFSLILDGYLTLAECYMVSVPLLSWQMVLVGDPLYRPFQKNIPR